MKLLHKNYAVTTKLSNCPTCRSVLGLKFGRSEVSWVRSVLGPKCVYTIANPRPVARIKTGRVAQPITGAVDTTGRDRSWICNAPQM